MPYRRLPNTDQARLRALKAALQKGMQLSPFDLAFSQKLFLELQSFLPQYEQAISQYNFSKDRQAKYGKLLGDQFKITRLYVSHFIQVLNFCIIRGEIKPEVRKLYGFDIEEKAVPELGTEQQLLLVGKSVIEGEEKRGMTGGSRIYNPSIAMVKIKYEKFVEYYNNHKNLLVTTQKMHDKVIELRNAADRIVLHIWNEIEDYFDNLEGDEKRMKCANYGIVYLLRKHEKEPLE
ncbi:hypothetical protein KEM09_00975 [Carboxylicivirga mesophila]|uniref:Nucleotide modification associated domain-containing protein n=1 Tax=Carboxylicivirga mesophila TaxID=1166478 RepID=A0ABS5K616_9BACT|nr:hypothetical protein [Carboxylicivirga mesophila]MBS2209956.1 hypothetical protein [Carboxylicivirga mesophila]